MVKKKVNNQDPSSFRDPSGFVYYENQNVFRQVNQSFSDHFDRFTQSGLMHLLIDSQLLVPHTKLSTPSNSPQIHSLYQAEKIPFISYPFEWTFSQLKDAALLTLHIQKIAIEHNMTLKDASAYNIQFKDGQPIFIDLLSFEEYVVGKPWIAYQQFCQHFLGPLLLMSYVDIRLNQLLRVHIDGIPLDLVSKLLPRKTLLSFSIASHIHLHARNQSTFADTATRSKKREFSLSKIGLLGIIDSLESLVKSLKYGKEKTEWGEYYTFTNYSDAAFQHKKTRVESFLNIAKPKNVWDIGANSGEFSRVASQKGIFTVSSDLDPIAVEKNYLSIKHSKEKNLLPLIIDLTNPSSSLGWANAERKSFMQRGPADLVMALALIHHLAISNNLPFSHIAEFFSKIGKHLIIEFVPKSDSQVQKLLATRTDIFGTYDQKHFEESFSDFFTLIKKSSIPESKRTLYLFQTK